MSDPSLIEKCDAAGDIGPLDDGFQHFWAKDRGAFSAADLREIADELDRRNKDWQAQIDREFAGPTCPHAEEEGEVCDWCSHLEAFANKQGSQ